MAIIRHVKIENFRGISALEWDLQGRIICLIGPCDSCKTTILDAIEYALSPRWNLVFSDTDFFQGNPKTPFFIELTIGELPDELVSEDKYGLYLRGYNPNTGIMDDPDETCDQVLTLRLEVDQTLEPNWTLVKASNPDQKLVSYRDRESLGVARLGDDAERHLTWGRGSGLTRLSGKDSSADALVLAHRAAQNAINSASLTELQQVAIRVQQTAKEFGVNVTELKPGLNLEGTKIGQAAIALYDKNVPLSAAGLGTRRLSALAVQQTGLGPRAIVLIDEIEHGLEPHRIRQVLKKMCDDHRNNQNPPTAEGQVIMTIHSPTSIMELNVEEIRFVRCNQGTVSVLKANSSAMGLLQRIVRTTPHAFLAQRLIVCEGKTEEAICRAIEEIWSKTHENLPMAYYGIAPIHGGGTDAATLAFILRSLNYDVLYFGDSDIPLNPDEHTLRGLGVEVVTWPGMTTTEDRIALDLPFSGLQVLVNLAAKIFGTQAIVNAIRSKMDGKNIATLSLSNWLSSGMREEDIRKVIGTASRKTLGGWFKDITAGMNLGRIVANVLPEIPASPLATTLKRIEDWIYGP